MVKMRKRRATCLDRDKVEFDYIAVMDARLAILWLRPYGDILLALEQSVSPFSLTLIYLGMQCQRQLVAF